MTLQELVADPVSDFEVPYNVVTWKDGKNTFLFSNMLTASVPDELQNKTVLHVRMQDGFIEIEI